MIDFEKTPDNALLKLSSIIGTRRACQSHLDSARYFEPPIIPVSRSTWWAGVKSGKYPKPVKLGQRSIAWKAGDIKNLLDEMGGAQ